MKRIILLFVNAILLTTLMPSCETDFDVSADWKDITIVYGLLNQDDSVHYLKINKAFLGDGNALEYAQLADSSSYFNNLEVFITEVRENGSTRVLNFDTAHISNKDDGIFYSSDKEDDVVVYKSKFDLVENGSQYNLMVRNKLTGKEVTSSTRLVKDFSITTPRPGQTNIDFISENNQYIKWQSAVDGKRYDLFIRFWFTEVRNTYDTTHRYIDWNLGTVKSKALTGGEDMSLVYLPQGFFTACKTYIPYKKAGEEAEVTSRLTDRVQFKIAVSGDAFNTYLDVNGSSSGVVQDRPEFTNIENGLGLFSCRYIKSNSIIVGAQTEARLIALDDLKFVDKLGNK